MRALPEPAPHDSVPTIPPPIDPSGKNKLRKYPCFGGCEHGVNIALFPDRVFLSKVGPEDVPALCDFLCGQGAALKNKKGIVAPDIENIVWELLDTGF